MAAACRAASLMLSTRLQSIFVFGLAVLFMISSAFPRLGQSRRDHAHALATLHICDGEYSVSDHTEQDVAIFAVIFASVFPHDGEGVCESKTGELEAHAVSDQILCRLGIIPLKIVIVHLVRSARSCNVANANAAAQT
jgi:hypothetical protein